MLGLSTFVNSIRDGISNFRRAFITTFHRSVTPAQFAIWCVFGPPRWRCISANRCVVVLNNEEDVQVLSAHSPQPIGYMPTVISGHDSLQLILSVSRLIMYYSESDGDAHEES